MDTDQTAERGLHIDSNNIRFSNSPARQTQIQHVQSPTKSIHPESSAMASQMQSIDNQPDFGHRTIDFFDDDSDDEEGLPRAITTDDLISRPRSQSPGKRKQMPPSGQSFASRCEPKRVSMKALEPESEGYQRMDSTLNQHVPHPDSPDTESYVGSVEEFLPRKSHEDGQRPKSGLNQFHTSGREWKSSAPLPMHQSMHENVRASSMYSDRIDQRLGVHQMAYEMLIQGMMNDQELMDSNRSPLKQQRASALPAALRTHDPRSPRDQLPAKPSPEQTSPHRSSQSRKKAQFVPPPIDIDSTRHSLPSDLVRTPYPTSATDVLRKDTQPLQDTAPSTLPSHSATTDGLLLTLSIRRSNPNARPRITALVLPATNAYSAIRTTEKGYLPETQHSFDDETLALHLRKAYKSLSSGPVRFLSARTLTRIVVSGPSTRTADALYARPVVLHKQASTTRTEEPISEEKLLQTYLSPRLGRQKFTFVHWARRLASAEKDEEDEGEEREDTVRSRIRRCESGQSETAGLEFIVGWSAGRILSVLLFVILLAIVASLLWIFLGTQSTRRSFGNANGSAGGFRGAGDRVGAGVLLGGFVLLVGLAGFGGWLGVSWLVM